MWETVVSTDARTFLFDLLTTVQQELRTSFRPRTPAAAAKDLYFKKYFKFLKQLFCAKLRCSLEDGILDGEQHGRHLCDLSLLRPSSDSCGGLEYLDHVWEGELLEAAVDAAKHAWRMGKGQNLFVGKVETGRPLSHLKYARTYLFFIVLR